MIQHELLKSHELPSPGTVISIDAEFVALQPVCCWIQSLADDVGGDGISLGWNEEHPPTITYVTCACDCHEG